MAATGHPLATMAAVRMLERGGNAIDAGVAAGICINVLLPDLTNIGGVAPIILYRARDNAIRTISGLGNWPQAVSREYFVNECGGTIPTGVRRSVMPAGVDAWLTALREFGTLSFAEVVEPALQLCEEGFPVYFFLHEGLAEGADNLARWPSSAAVFLPDGRVPAIGERFVQRDLAGMFRMLIEAEASSRHNGRAAGIKAARDRFYTGDIAERIAAFYQQEGGFLTLDDLKRFHVEIEEPLHVRYHGYDVYGCGPWCQGPVALEALGILDGYDVTALGQNSADTLHLIIEALSAAFADRHHYVGDPRFVDVPTDGMLSPVYAATWRDRIRMDRAFGELPTPGNPWQFNATDGRSVAAGTSSAFAAPVEPDTSYLCIVDREGNAFSATPSDGVTSVPVVPGLGFIVSGRGVQSWLDADHPSAVAPGKRPRLTPNPGLIMKDGRLFAPYGTPGNDVQPQAMVQLAVNLIDFGLDPQTAIEAPRVASYGFPQSTHPHPYLPGVVRAEGRLPDAVLEELAGRGHTIERWPAWSALAGSLCTIVVDEANGALIGGADPRRVAYAMGW
jgi:gamma-glutamyltranspeptidase/glutathione hydrolase